MKKVLLTAAVLWLLDFSIAGAQSPAAPLSFDSGAGRVALLELYTSEGCSSCPPADRWLRSLEGDTGLWTRFVPVALHVDYWNYIGWRDPFSAAAYSARQRRHVALGGARTVYTPGFFYNGEEWLDWRRNDRPVQVPGHPGSLTLSIDGDQVAIRFAATQELRGGLQLSIAVLGMGLASDVTAGENRGKTLRHDFVVMDLQQLPMQSSGDTWLAHATLAQVASNASRYAVAAWVSRPGTQTPLQAVGGLLPLPAAD
jgi:hypothetical protein